MNLDKKTLLDSLYSKIMAETADTLLAKEASGLVRGHGSADAKVILVGEAPGKKEDESGKPFVGASGKMLDKLLASIDISRKEVYITNIVKFRPKDNRDPSSKEKQLFFPYLSEEIDIIQPALLVTLGRHSMNEFLPNVTIGQVHGQLQHIKGGYPILPLYHPAAAMYNGSLRKTLFEDVRTVSSFIR